MNRSGRGSGHARVSIATTRHCFSFPWENPNHLSSENDFHSEFSPVASASFIG
jgi:hypothetical protein